MQIIDGKKMAQDILLRLKSQATPQKTLVAFLVGDDSASISFIRQKEKTAKKLGVDFKVYTFSDDISEENLIKEIESISKMDFVGGVIVQLPLPEAINRQSVLNAIPAEKDVDVLSEKAQEVFRAGTNPVLPPSVGTTEAIIHNSKLIIQNSNVAIVGLGFLVGKPISEWLKEKTKELFFLDLGDDLSILKEADLVISGTGQAGLIKAEMLKEGAGVIDFGYGLNSEEKPSGDFDTNSLVNQFSNYLSFYTPTPGGTGPILVAKLLENFYKLNR